MRNPYKKPRPAYCTGCGTVFDKMHRLRDHRHTFKCGGKWEILRKSGVEINAPARSPSLLLIPDNQSTCNKIKRSVRTFPVYQFSKDHQRWLWL